MTTTTHDPWQEEPFELVRRHDPNDARILRDVRTLLAGVLGSEARNLVVLVENGELTLVGRVAERWMQLEIEHGALHVEGVRHVASRVTAPKIAPK